jgi:hypothetical protein
MFQLLLVNRRWVNFNFLLFYDLSATNLTVTVCAVLDKSVFWVFNPFCNEREETSLRKLFAIEYH